MCFVNKNMAEQNYGVANVNTDLAYDLRQKYAQVVGEHLEDVAQARKRDNYSIYFKALKDLFIVVRHKFKNKKMKKKDKEKEMTQIEYYDELVSSAVKVANNYPRTWLGQDKNPTQCAEIESKLNDIEMFLYEKIDEAKMFGGSSITPGL